MPFNYDLCFKTKHHWIYVPTDECRTRGKQIVATISKKWSPPENYFHFKDGGHIAAIRQHQEKTYFAKTDLQNFFPSISKARIIRSLKAIGFSYEEAKDIASWSTVVCKEDGKNILPFGFVQSQLIAAVCMEQSALGTFIQNNLPNDIALTVYVDDILLSSDNLGSLGTVYEGLMEAIRLSGFRVSEAKSHPPQNATTVFNINLDRDKTEISENRFQEFLSQIAADEPKKSEALIAYTQQVCDWQGNILNNRFLEQLEVVRCSAT